MSFLQLAKVVYVLFNGIIKFDPSLYYYKSKEYHKHLCVHVHKIKP